MSDINHILTKLREHKAELSQRYLIKRLGIFGSYARGEEVEASDLDILVELSGPIGLDFVALGDELENLLGIKIDLLSAGSIKNSLRKSIYEDIIYV